MTDERKGLPSASSWRRHELCAGSWQLEQEAKRLGQEAHKSSPAAARGSLIHAYLAGEKVELSLADQKTADFLKERAEEQVRRIFGDQPINVLKEKRLWLKLP
jgi:hypothetical protein